MTKAKIGFNLVGIGRDHSASMRGLTHKALADFNTNLNSIKHNAINSNKPTLGAIVEIGYGSTDRARIAHQLQSINYISPLLAYEANGNGTPLYDGVNLLIDALENSKEARQKNTTFLVMVITDGRENASTYGAAAKASKRIKELQGTDRWTFTFRVPVGHSSYLVQNGIPSGNILEWEQTDAGFTRATQQTQVALDTYYGNLSRGITSTKSFYQTNIDPVKARQITTKLNDVSKDFQFLPVNSYDSSTGKDWTIRPFVEYRTGNFKKGEVFYQLMKTEKVQDHKEIMVRDRRSGEVFAGVQARNILGLPQYGLVKVTPGNQGRWDIFVQSTSVNRILPEGTAVLVRQ